MDKKQNTKEIDLIELFFKLFMLIKRNFLIIIIALVIGAAYSIYAKYSAKKLFQSDYIIAIDKNRIAMVDEIISNISDLAKTNDTLLSDELNIPLKDAEKVNEIKLVFEKQEEDELNTGVVKLKILHQYIDSISPITKALVDKINNVEYFKRRREKRIAHIMQSISEIKLKIEETDSLQKLFMESYLKNNKLIYFNQDNSQSVLQRQKLTLIVDIQKLEDQLDNINELYIVDGTTKKINFSLLKMVIYPVLTVFLALLFIFFKEINKFEKKRRKKA